MTNMPYLICERCGLEQELPEHHGAPMQPRVSGSGDAKRLICGACGHEVAWPMHCGQPMKLVE